MILAEVVLLVWALTSTALTAQDREPSEPSRTLEIEMQVSAGTTAQMFWSATGQFSEQQSAKIPLRQDPGAVQRLSFTFPAAEGAWVRLDPTDAPAEIRIVRLTLLDGHGGHIVVDPMKLRPAYQILSILRERDGARIVTAPNGADPFLILQLEPAPRKLLTVTTGSLLVVGAFTLGLLFACGFVVVRSALSQPTGQSPVPPASKSTPVLFVLAVVFLTVFAAKLVVIRDNPALTPFWDQWDAEAAVVFLPFADGSLSWQSMAALHNEHRVFFTRLLALALLVANGQWDPQLESVVNAAGHALTVALVLAMLWVSVGRRRLEMLALVCGFVAAMPFGWENTLFGFQSAFYFLLLFSILAIWLTGFDVLTAPWCLGWACAFAVLLTAASGVLVPATIAVLVVLCWVSDRRAWRSALINGVAAAGALLLGWALSSPALPHHASLKPSTAIEFGIALARNLAWPWVGAPFMAAVLWLPLAVVLAQVALTRLKGVRNERFLIGLGAWVALNAVAVALGRGAGGAPPAPRYMDFLSLGVMVNAAAVARIFDSIARPAVRRLAIVLAFAWFAQAAVGIDRLTTQAQSLLAGFRPFLLAQTANTRRFVLTDDVLDLASKVGPSEIPYPDPYRLASLLREPALRGVLPAAVRQPLRIEPRSVTPRGFVVDGPFAGGIPRDPLRPAWWSLSDEGRRARGRFDSQPMRCHHGGRLTFEVAGYLGWEDLYLAIRDLEGQRDIPIRPTRVARENWLEVEVPCPAGMFEIVAIDESDQAWFGFREPIETARGSRLAEPLIRHARTALAALLALAMAGLAWRAR